jgi:AcrR family transcriptional regulator
MPTKPALRPRTKPSEERCDDLMNSAERLFLEKGLDQTTVEEITQGADVAKGTFYLHFSSKVDVLEALRARFVQGVLDRIVVNVARQKEQEWRGKLAAWSKACAVGYLDAARLHHLVFVTAPPATKAGLSRNSLVDHLTELLEAGNDNGAWLIDDPRFTAVFLFNALHGIVNQPGIGADRRSRNRLLHSLEDHFLRSLGISPSGEKG